MLAQLKGVTKKYGRTYALNDVSLDFEPGQIVAILGPNGAGKTTLLRCLAGVVAPDRGELRFDGELFRREDLVVRRRMMFLPDFPMLFYDDTVARNLAIFLRLYEAERADSASQVIELLREFDLLPLAASPPMALSRGQIYKVALSGLLAVDPEIWLLDEPLASGMDPHGLAAFKRHARSAADRGRTVLFTTQMLDTAEKLADRVCVLQDGIVRSFASIEEIRAQAADPDNPLEDLFRKLREDRA